MRCDELMTTNPEVLRLYDDAHDAAIKMRDAKVGFLPVLDDAEQVVGVLTDRDLAVRVMAESLPVETGVEDLMTIDVIACAPEDDLERAEALMRANQKSRLPVVDEDGHLAGVISIADIVQYEDASRAGDVAGDATAGEVRIP